MSSFRRALAAGAETIELDVRRLRDGTLVVHHDERIGLAPLSRMTRATLPLVNGEPIPTLEEVLAFARENGLRLQVELKEAGTERPVLEQLAASGVPADRLKLMAFDPSVVRTLKYLRPDLQAGLLLYELPLTQRLRTWLDPNGPIDAARAVGADFLAVHHWMANEDLIARTEAAGLPLAVWTVDRPADLARLLGDDRVDQVITDLPDLALGVLRRTRSQPVADAATAAGLTTRPATPPTA